MTGPIWHSIMARRKSHFRCMFAGPRRYIASAVCVVGAVRYVVEVAAQKMVVSREVG